MSERSRRESTKLKKKDKRKTLSHRDIDVRELVDRLSGVEGVLDELAHRRVEGLAGLFFFLMMMSRLRRGRGGRRR